MQGIAEVSNDCPRSYFFEETEMTLYTTGPCENSNKVYSWKIQDNPQSSQFAYAEGLDTIGANHDGAAFAYQGGKFVLFSGKGIISDGTSEFLEGQLISKCLLVTSNLPKKQGNFCQDFCPMREGKLKKRALFTANCWILLLFFDLTSF